MIHTLSRALAIATNDILPLSVDGQRQWPQLNSDTSMILAAASCSAEPITLVVVTFSSGSGICFVVI